MAKYIVAYLGGNPPKTQEEGQAHFAEYRKWLRALGEAVVSPANPFKNTHTIDPDGSVEEGSSSAMSGYTVIEADSMASALAMVKDCPFLGIGGTLEVSELAQMSI